MAKQSCWRYKKCGREPGGKHVDEMGVCPAAQTNPTVTGLNRGKNAGRICWAVAGTYCGGKIQGDFARKQLTCMTCDFFKQVQSEEGGNFYLLIPGQVYQPPVR